MAPSSVILAFSAIGGMDEDRLSKLLTRLPPKNKYTCVVAGGEGKIERRWTLVNETDSVVFTERKNNKQLKELVEGTKGKVCVIFVGAQCMAVPESAIVFCVESEEQAGEESGGSAIRIRYPTGEEEGDSLLAAAKEADVVHRYRGLERAILTYNNIEKCVIRGIQVKSTENKKARLDVEIFIEGAKEWHVRGRPLSLVKEFAREAHMLLEEAGVYTDNKILKSVLNKRSLLFGAEDVVLEVSKREKEYRCLVYRKAGRVCLPDCIRGYVCNNSIDIEIERLQEKYRELGAVADVVLQMFRVRKPVEEDEYHFNVRLAKIKGSTKAEKKAIMSLFKDVLEFFSFMADRKEYIEVISQIYKHLCKTQVREREEDERRVCREGYLTLADVFVRSGSTTPVSSLKYALFEKIFK